MSSPIDHLPPEEAEYLRHLLGQVALLKQIQHAPENLQGFLAYLQAKHGLPDGTEIAPDGTILHPI